MDQEVHEDRGHNGGSQVMPCSLPAALQAKGVVTDGPFMEAKELLGGIGDQGEHLRRSPGDSQECPAHADGSSIEIREMAGLAG